VIKLVLVLASTLLLATVGTAQGFNIDVGISPAPASSYGAAAGQPGSWNAIPAGLPAALPLLDLAGNPTGALIQRPWSNPISFQSGSSGDDLALLDDYWAIDFTTVVVSGLTPGNYLVYTYTMLASGVVVHGSTDPLQPTGFAWPGSMVHGVTHTIHHVASNGTIEIEVVYCGFCEPFLAGLQIVPELPGQGFDLCLPGLAGTGVCPCSNPPGAATSGCDNSSSTGGATLLASGTASLSADTLVLSTIGEPPTATSVVSQGDLAIPGVVFGQGVRCVGGNLKRLYTRNASAGHVSVPGIGAPTISARAAALGDVLAAGTQRHYYVYYRDPVVFGGCPAASTFNVTQAGSVTWSP
jgi:hypothetical protein